MIVGHAAAVADLTTDLPPVTLLSGPAGIGKKALAEHLLAVHDVPRCEVLTLEHLDVEAAHALLAHIATAPIAGHKVVLADLDGASEPALHMLLKALEEMPPRCHVLMWRSGPTLLTVESRAHVVRLGLLTAPEVARVLTDVLGVPAHQAEEWAINSGGQVGTALKWQQTCGAKSSAVALLRAVATADLDLFDNALAGADANTVTLLRRWAMEVRTGRIRTFTAAESAGLERDAALAEWMLRGLTPHTRPRLALRATLAPALERRRTT